MLRLLVVWLALLAGASYGQTAQAPASASDPVQRQVASVVPADAPVRRDAEQAGTAGSYSAWLIVLAVAAGGLWLVRRGRVGGWPLALPRPAGAGPTVVASRALGPHASLQVVVWNGKEMLLGCSAQAITLLDSRPVTADPPPAVREAVP